MITFLKKLIASVPTPSTGKVTVFVDSTSGEPYYKDETGTAYSMVGADGEGSPAGGTTGQVLAKASDVDYDVTWRTLGTAADRDAGVANGVATLGSTGVIPSSQLPSIAVTDTFVVSSEAEQLALTAEKGDIAVRTDQNQSYINNGGTSGTMSDWTALLTPTDAVQSVNGQTGNVDLDYSDVGAQAASASLTSIAALTTSANQSIYTTAANTWATYSLTAAGRSLASTAGTANTMPYFSATDTISLVTTTDGGRALLSASGAAASIPYFSASNTVGAISTTTGGRALLAVPGSSGTFPYFSEANTVSSATLGTTGLALAGAASAAAARTTLGLGSAALSATTDFATAAQGTKADTAVQPGSLATVATSGDYADLLNKPTIPAAQVNSDWNATSGLAQILNKPTLGTAAAQDSSAFATSAQGAKADSAVQPSALGTAASRNTGNDAAGVVPILAQLSSGQTSLAISGTNRAIFDGTSTAADATSATTLQVIARAPNSTSAGGDNRIGIFGFNTDGLTPNARGGKFLVALKVNGSTTITERISILNDGTTTITGNLVPGADNTYNVGSASARPIQYYGVNTNISTSDERLKTGLRDMTAAEVAAFAAIARLPNVWRWIERTETEGDDARLHSGPTVQAAIAIMAAHGLDWRVYAAFCYDEWPEQPEEIYSWPEEHDEDGNVIREAGSEIAQPYRPAGDRYSFRREELLSLIVRAQATQYDDLEKRVGALESKE